MRYLVGSDHAGVNIKKFIIDYLQSLNIDVLDIYQLAKDERVDYPDITNLLCERMLTLGDCMGILVCGSGIGVSISANRFSHIRAALCTNSYMATMARKHNDANVLCLGERVSGLGVVKSILDSFICMEFEGGRHIKRVEKLSMRRVNGK